MKRGAGILMPIFSLCGEERFGTMGKCAYDFVDFLAMSKQTYWQVLPINDVDEYGSPFCSPCSYSGNPLFIDLSSYLTKSKLKQIEGKKLSYDEYKSLKMELLYKVYKDNDFNKEIDEFIKENSWVISYSEFMVIKEQYTYLKDFPCYLKNKNSLVCKKFLKNNVDRVRFYAFTQYLFFKQWNELKEYANSKGILIIGDSPCNSAMDSKEAWADREMYLLDDTLTPTFVAGVPPDYFSSLGQVWNTLIYNYDVIKKDNYKYLLDKYKYLLNVYDYLKIDHFRGLEYFYKIPYGSEDGKIGEWVPGPGYEFIDLLKSNDINNLILEDLGIISDGVVRLKDYSGYPGMKVYEFAFDFYNSPFLPDNYGTNCVAYTGTHDNDTLFSYLSNKENCSKVSKYLKLDKDSNKEEVIYESIKRLYNSKADVVIINPQDLLMEGNEARFNTPGTIKGNWNYKSNKNLYQEKNISFLSNLVLESRRG